MMLMRMMLPLFLMYNTLGALFALLLQIMKSGNFLECR
jgi:hypothetical protein